MPPRHTWTLLDLTQTAADGSRNWTCGHCGVVVVTRHIMGPRWTYAETWTPAGGVPVQLGRYDRRPGCASTQAVVAACRGTGRREKRRSAKPAKDDSIIPSDEAELLQRLRPRDRSECRGGQRPCPWYGCRYHLGLDVTPSGRIKLSPVALEDMADTCAMDVADRAQPLELSLDQVAGMLDVSTERARQIEHHAQARLRALQDLAMALPFEQRRRQVVAE